MILVLPLLKHLILRISQRFGIIRVTLALQSREHHRQLVRIRSLGLEAVFESQVNIGSPGKPVAKHLLRRQDAMFLPQERMAPAGAEIGNVELGQFPELLQLRVELNLGRSEEHTSELQSLMRISYAVFCLKKK